MNLVKFFCILRWMRGLFESEIREGGVAKTLRRKFVDGGFRYFSSSTGTSNQWSFIHIWVKFQVVKIKKSKISLWQKVWLITISTLGGGGGAASPRPLYLEDENGSCCNTLLLQKLLCPLSAGVPFNPVKFLQWKFQWIVTSLSKRRTIVFRDSYWTHNLKICLGVFMLHLSHSIAELKKISLAILSGNTKLSYKFQKW
jgi:hypothetical protein